jgi:hypothetical protein
MTQAFATVLPARTCSVLQTELIALPDRYILHMRLVINGGKVSETILANSLLELAAELQRRIGFSPDDAPLIVNIAAGGNRRRS